MRSVVDALHAAWADAFARRDAAALAALYADDATLYGSTAALYRGRAEVQRYFTELPTRFKSARYEPGVVTSVGPAAVAVSGLVGFGVEDAGIAAVLPYRMTQVLALVQGRWLIAVHHASPVPGG